MPGNHQLSVDELVREVKETASLGIPAILLFGLRGEGRRRLRGLRARTALSSKPSGPSKIPSRTFWSSRTCACASTRRARPLRRGGARAREKRPTTLEAPGESRRVPRRGGADMVAPRHVMDGRVAAIPRGAGRERPWKGRPSWPMRPSTRAASTARSARRRSRRHQFGDRRALPDGPGQQRRGPSAEVALDLDEGPNMVMRSKPALAYLESCGA